MITYEEAIKIAQNYDPEISHCEEYENVYIFDVDTEEETTGPQPLVIIKETGETLPFPEFLCKGINIGEKLGEWLIHVTLRPTKGEE